MLKITGRRGLSVSDTKKGNMAAEGKVRRSNSKICGIYSGNNINGNNALKKAPETGA